MGEKEVKLIESEQAKQKVHNDILQDIHALEKIIENGLVESGTNKIGFEQELCFVDSSCRPAPIISEYLKKYKKDNLQVELAKYNLEINSQPLELKDNVFSKAEKNLTDEINEVRNNANEIGYDIILTGILPTIKKMDLVLENLSPDNRSSAMIEAMEKLRKDDYDIRISGMDDLVTKDFSNMFQASNTSFQIHYQTSSEEFADKYNFAQLISAPVLAVSSNSPILFGKRLWHETRIAMFQQAVDTRDSTYHLADNRKRVPFGRDWVKNSITEIFKNDLADYKIFLENLMTEDTEEKFDKEGVPYLRALDVFNSTVFRWNRAVFDKTNGKMNFRIENRLLPSGPSIIDEIANAAFWAGLMHGMPEEYRNLRDKLEFEYTKINLTKAARYGMNAEIDWLNNRKMNIQNLILEELLPIAKKGLEDAEVTKKDIDKYLGIIENRAENRMTGAQWQLDMWNKLTERNTKDVAAMLLTESIKDMQKTNLPVNEWGIPDDKKYKLPDIDNLQVDQFMTTDLQTVDPDMLIDKVSYKMLNRKLYHVPVCTPAGEVKGVLDILDLLEHYSIDENVDGNDITVKEIMNKEFKSIKPETNISEVINIMSKNNTKALLVLKDNKLVGIITQFDMMQLSKIFIKKTK